MLHSSSCRSQGPGWDPLTHSLEWAHNRCIPLGASHSWLHLGPRRTSARRTSCSTSRRLTSPSTPSSADRPYTGSWPLPITGIWSSRCRLRPGSSLCRATAPLRLRLWKSCTPRRWREEPLDLWYQGAYQGVEVATIRSRQRPRQGRLAQCGFLPDHSHCG
jgi:hypothetical protein